jgi:hypothetical protein
MRQKVENQLKESEILVGKFTQLAIKPSAHATATHN